MPLLLKTAHGLSSNYLLSPSHRLDHNDKDACLPGG